LPFWAFLRKLDAFCKNHLVALPVGHCTKEIALSILSLEINSFHLEVTLQARMSKL